MSLLDEQINERGRAFFETEGRSVPFEECYVFNLIVFNREEGTTRNAEDNIILHEQLDTGGYHGLV